MKHASVLLLVVTALITGCAPAIRPAAPSAMVPAMLKRGLLGGTHIYVTRVTLGSAAASGKAPFDELTGKFPLVQEQGLANYRASVRLTLIAAGAQSPADSDAASYLLRPVILGGMAIPFAQSYAVLFVHYQLEDSKTGKVVWSKNIYSQAKLENTRVAAAGDGAPDPAYGLLAAANLRQMVTSLAAYLAATPAHSKDGTLR